MKRQNVRTLSLVVCTFTYLLVGAAVFDALESDTEQRRWEALSEIRDRLLSKYNISMKEYKLIETIIIENKPHKAGPQWKFTGAFYFAIVVLALIGYGHSTPSTASGKAFCMAYAIIGIPLGLVMFQSIGERLNKFVSIVIGKIKLMLKRKKTEATELDLMAATGFLSSVIITAGAAVFSRYEKWSYLDSFYYCFVTLTTIGFGDFVALQNDRALTSRPGYVTFSLVFILFGLAVVAGCMNLLVLRFMTMNAEDIKKEETELVAASRSVITFDGDFIIDTKRNRFAGKDIQCESDQVSVCSCTCYNYNPTPRTTKLDCWPWALKVPLLKRHIFSEFRKKNRYTGKRASQGSSRLSKITFGIDAIWPSTPPPPQYYISPNVRGDVFTELERQYRVTSYLKRASI